jgi:serine/threonine-protein kinase
LTKDGAVKVLDFGIARMRELQSARLTLTTQGAIGTPAFMPPEQARGRWDDVGPRSDIWAVGATMFTLVAGRLVHTAPTVNELMLAAMTKPAPPVASAVPGLPPQVAEVIDRALSYEIKDRWADARAMQNALRGAYQSFDRMSLPAPLPAYAGPASAPMSAVMPIAPPPPSVSATGQPVMMGAAPPPAKKGGFPLLAVVGGVAGAAVVGLVLFFLLLRGRAQDPASTTASAAMSASSVPAAAAPSASATAAPEDAAAPTASASAPAPEASAAPTAGATASAAATAPKVPSKPKTPGKTKKFFNKH